MMQATSLGRGGHPSLGDCFGIIAALDGTPIILGGRSGHMAKSTACVRMLQPRTGVSRPLGRLVQPTFQFAMGKLPGGRITLAGGGWTPTKQAMIYNSEERRSTKLPGMHQSRIGCSGCVLPDGRFVVLGGEDFLNMGCVSGTDVLESCEAFDFSRWCWQALPDMQVARSEFAAWVIGNLVLVSGGKGRGHHDKYYILSSTEVLDLSASNMAWEFVPWLMLPSPVYGMGSELHCSG